jgi:hypothetical protein
MSKKQMKMIGNYTAVYQCNASKDNTAHWVVTVHDKKHYTTGTEGKFSAEKHIRTIAQQVIHKRVKFDSAS